MRMKNLRCCALAFLHLGLYAADAAILGAQGIEMTYKGDTFEIFVKDSPNRLVFTVPGTKGVTVLPHQQVL